MSDPRHPGLELCLAMSIGPNWHHIDRLRQAVLNCIAVIVGEGDSSEAVGIIVSELLENAIKYGHWTDSETSILRLNLTGDHDRVQIDVTSPTEPASHHYAELLKTLEWIRSFSSPRDAYRERIRQLVDAGSEGSKMGLVRIAQEGPCTLEAHLEEGNILLTRAVAHLAPRSRA